MRKFLGTGPFLTEAKATFLTEAEPASPYDPPKNFLGRTTDSLGEPIETEATED